MNIRTAKAKVIIGVVLVGITTTTAVVLFNNRPTAQAIPPMTWFKQAQKLSKGDKATCLPNVQSVADAVYRDDVSTEFKGNKFSNFEETESTAIADVPAGTNYNLTINAYANHVVKGTMTYDKGYGTYNYTTKKLPAHGQWQLVSIIACKKS